MGPGADTGCKKRGGENSLMGFLHADTDTGI